MAITIMELAQYRLGLEDADHMTGADFQRANLDILGGCEICAASIAAYNAYPSRSGYWRCADCVGDDGFKTVQEAQIKISGDGDIVTVERPDAEPYRAMVLAVRGSGPEDGEVRVIPYGGRGPLPKVIRADWVPLGQVT